MNNNFEEFNYSLRWIFSDLEQHELNVKTLLKSEQALTEYIYDIAKELSIPIEIKAIAKEKGSLISEFKIIWKNNKDRIVTTAIPSLLAITLTAFFQQIQTPKVATLEKEKFVIELQEKVNNGTLTVEQAETYIENFSSISKYKNAFFKANKADNEVSEIEVKQDGTVTSKISREQFDEYISQSESNETVVSNAKVYIISPVLVTGTKEKWTGEYDGENIRFHIKDKEFLEKAQNKVISFNTGFFIICELRKIVKTIDGKEHITWEVLEVTHRAIDEDNIVSFEHTKRKKNKKIPGQMSLFE